MVSYDVGVIEFGEHWHLFQEFKGLGIIVIDHHLFNCVNIRIDSMLTAVDSSEPTFSYHFQFLIVYFITASGVRMFRDVVLQRFMHYIHIISFFILAIEDFEYDILIYLFFYFFLCLFLLYILLARKIHAITVRT